MAGIERKHQAEVVADRRVGAGEVARRLTVGADGDRGILHAQAHASREAVGIGAGREPIHAPILDAAAGRQQARPFQLCQGDVDARRDREPAAAATGGRDDAG